MTAHLLHGAFVLGEPKIQQLAQYTPGPDLLHKYGFAAPPLIKIANWRAINDIESKLESGDTLVGHSNGCLIAYKLVERMIAQGKTPKAVVTIAPAMRRDTEWPPGDYRVLCIYNPYDWVVEAGRVWGRLFGAETGIAHGWGAAGRKGFTTPDTRISNFPANRDGWEQHILPDEYIDHVGPKIKRWLELR